MPDKYCETCGKPFHVKPPIYNPYYNIYFCSSECENVYRGKRAAEREAYIKKELSKSKYALNTQVDGDHYKKYKIQPIEYIEANNLPFIEGAIVKYITRWQDKGGKKDLEKIKHFCDILIDYVNCGMRIVKNGSDTTACSCASKPRP